MAKQGMKHYYTKIDNKKAPTVQEIRGKAKSGKVKARNLIAGENGKVYHGISHVAEPKIPSAFSAIDNDLAVENLSNDFDMTAADMQDLQ